MPALVSYGPQVSTQLVTTYGVTHRPSTGAEPFGHEYVTVGGGIACCGDALRPAQHGASWGIGTSGRRGCRHGDRRTWLPDSVPVAHAVPGDRRVDVVGGLLSTPGRSMTVAEGHTRQFGYV
jgi:hypothetical protein